MSLAIDVDMIAQVLLDDGWHTVLEQSFKIDSYEYVWYPEGDRRDLQLMHGGGNNGVCAAGYSFKTHAPMGGGVVYMQGPLTAILGVTRSVPIGRA